MIYKHRKSGRRVEAVQFTGPESIQKISSELGISLRYTPGVATVCFNSQKIHRGDYIVSTGAVVVGEKAEWFEAQYVPEQVQGELF